jgi:sulfinoalanine decarboxylase/sulfinoalanine decarboxylase/aspartate 1-decarboxylase
MTTVDTLRQTLAVAEAFLSAELEHPGLPYRAPEDLYRSLELRLSEHGVDDTTFYRLLEGIALQTPRTAGIAFFNQLYGGRNLPALAGDLLAPVLNTSLYTYKVGGPHILLEKEVTRQMGHLMGYDAEADGVFTPGGSLSNLVGMLIARNRATGQNIKDDGFDGRKYTLYTSVESHYSIPKNAGILGLGRKQVRFVASDADGRMRPEDLRRQLDTDLAAGCVPFLVIATAGTTVLGAFDPVPALADIAAEYGLWLHLDAAYGGSVALSEHHRHLLTGAHRADSIVWNLHKMLNVPLPASVILVKQGRELQNNLQQAADYLFQGQDAEQEYYDHGHKSIQCGRRNDALKAWAAWKYFGRQGLARRVDRLFELTAYARQYVAQDPVLRLVAEPPLTTLCFTVDGCPSEPLCQALDHSGALKVSYGRALGQTFVRAVFVNPDLTFEDIHRFFELVKTTASGLRTTPS